MFYGEVKSVNSRNGRDKLKCIVKRQSLLVLNPAIRAVTTWLEMVKVFSKFLPWYSVNSRPRQLGRYRDLLGSGRSEDRIPVGRDNSYPSRPALGPTQPPVQCARGLFSGGKAAGTGP